MEGRAIRAAEAGLLCCSTLHAAHDGLSVCCLTFSWSAKALTLSPHSSAFSLLPPASLLLQVPESAEDAPDLERFLQAAMPQVAPPPTGLQNLTLVRARSAVQCITCTVVHLHTQNTCEQFEGRLHCTAWHANHAQSCRCLPCACPNCPGLAEIH